MPIPFAAALRQAYRAYKKAYLRRKQEIMNKSKKKPARIALICGIAAVLAALILIYSHFGGFGTGVCADTAEFSKYAAGISELTIPDEVQIVALGEAAHGNAEFQRLKLSVFRSTVEKYGIRAFALEGDFGGCEAVNRYIHGGDGTAADAAAAIGFAIYRTAEMEELISWMRSYNETAADGDDLRFYGFDMQRVAYNYRYLLEAAKKHGADTAELEAMWDGENNAYRDAYSPEQRLETLAAVRDSLPESDAQAIHFADILMQNITLGSAGAEYSVVRDEMMAENALWVLRQEQERGNRRIFISAHNGHVERLGSYNGGGRVTGNILADELGAAYYAVGTDFYKSVCNLPKGGNGQRLTRTFYSHDPLAKAAAECGFDEICLDFSLVPDESPLNAYIRGKIWMGSLGESYVPLIMDLLPVSYRVMRSPAELYNAMIFVADAHPTEIKPAA